MSEPAPPQPAPPGFRTRGQRAQSLRQRPVIAWLTGLSGAGKTSIAVQAERALADHGRHVMVLDGDNLRLGLNRDLGFTPSERAENVRRAAETARLMAEAGLVVVVALIAPLRADRAAARAIAGAVPFLEVYVDTPLATCEARDPKGLYGRARAGLIPDFTGLSAPYEPPLAPDLTIRTEGRDVEASAQALIAAVMRMSAPG